ncbi:hypothetical protein RintRC_2392 [Richelia intracellularis]|nr:hypothetical protein RintRC_2392 [Richelia intracellularis]
MIENASIKSVRLNQALQTKVLALVESYLEKQPDKPFSDLWKEG